MRSAIKPNGTLVDASGGLLLASEARILMSGASLRDILARQSEKAVCLATGSETRCRAPESVIAKCRHTQRAGPKCCTCRVEALLNALIVSKSQALMRGIEQSSPAVALSKCSSDLSRRTVKTLDETLSRCSLNIAKVLEQDAPAALNIT